MVFLGQIWQNSLEAVDLKEPGVHSVARESKDISISSNIVRRHKHEYALTHTSTHTRTHTHTHTRIHTQTQARMIDLVQGTMKPNP